jgi:methionine biosynthesis protein MetW
MIRLINAVIRTPYLAFRYCLIPQVIPQVRHAWRNVFSYTDILIGSMDYEKYWKGEHSAGSVDDIRIRTFIELVDERSSVTEIGCGDGTLLMTLKLKKDVAVKGYDISDIAVQQAKDKGLDVEVRDVSKTAIDHPCDYIIIADCLEHLADPEALLNLLRGMFRRRLLISIPNSCYWRYRFRILFGKFMVQWVAHPGEHLRFWSIPDMHWWARQNGFVVTKTYPTWGIPGLKHVWPNMFAQNVIYVFADPKVIPGTADSP